MGGETTNSPTTTVHSSSIALLQERFRQLQRVKEMREEKELLRLFTDADRVGPTTSYEPSKPFFHPDLIRPSRPQSLSVRSDPRAKIADGPLSMTLWPDKPIVRPTMIDLDDMDVDTSLHL